MRKKRLHPQISSSQKCKKQGKSMSSVRTASNSTSKESDRNYSICHLSVFFSDVFSQPIPPPKKKNCLACAAVQCATLVPGKTWNFFRVGPHAPRMCFSWQARDWLGYKESTLVGWFIWDDPHDSRLVGLTIRNNYIIIYIITTYHKY